MKKSLSLLSANILFLVTMLLVISLGAIVQSLNLSIGLMATEALLILLPALLFLRARGIALKEGLRLNPIRLRIGLICILLGFATFFFSALIDGIMTQLTGMQSVPVPENLLPKGAFESTLYFLAIAFFAPICEEVLFRGAIQGAYEARRPVRFTILVVGTMFAFYHFRLSGLPALLPVAFILGYVAWRTQSIYASILVHFGMNATAALNTVLTLQIGKGLPFLSLWTMLGGIVVAAGLLVLFQRFQPAPVAPLENAEGSPLEEVSRSKTYWPLLIAGLLYLSVAGLTLVTTLPGLIPSKAPEFTPSALSEPIESRYQITNRGGDIVGECTCRVTPHEDTVSLDCEKSIQAYQVKIANSYYADDEHTARWSATWDRQTLALKDFSFERKAASGGQFSSILKDGRLVATSADGTQQIDVTGQVMLAYEWAWRANNLKADMGSLSRAPYGYLSQWNEAEKKSIPVVKDELLRKETSETLTLPAGKFKAWKVTFGDQAVWYAQDDQPALRPIQFDDGMAIYLLEK